MKRVLFLAYLAPLLVIAGCASSTRRSCRKSVLDYDEDDTFWCPGPGDALDAIFCCGEFGAQYCCSDWTEDNITDLAAKLIGIVVGAVIFIVVVCVVCCCCCPFCLLYKRKQRGHVISRNPGVVTQGMGPGQDMGQYVAVSGQPGHQQAVQYPPQPLYQHQPVYPQQHQEPHLPQQPMHYPPQPAYPQQPPPYPGPPLASVQKAEYQTQPAFNPNVS